MSSRPVSNENDVKIGPSLPENNNATDCEGTETMLDKSCNASAVNKDDSATRQTKRPDDRNENENSLSDSLSVANENGRPKLSFIALIHLAIRRSKEQKLTLRGILRFIEDNFPYYSNKGPRWHASIRHNLSLNDCFIKVQKPSGEKGHGSYWMLDPDAANMYEHGSFQRRRTRYTKSIIDKGSNPSEAAFSDKKITSSNANEPDQEDMSSNQQRSSLISGENEENTTARNQKSSAKNSPELLAVPKSARTGFQSSFSIDSLLNKQSTKSPPAVHHPRPYLQPVLTTVPPCLAIPQQVVPMRYPSHPSLIGAQSILGLASQPQPSLSSWQLPRMSCPVRRQNMLRSTNFGLILPRWHPYLG